MVNVLAGKLGSKDMANNAMGRIKRLGLTERQQELNHLWAIYKCQQYDSRKLDWNGREHLDRMSSEVVAHAGYLPPGFVNGANQSNASFPLKFRRPTAPYSMVKTIVDRFSGLLFSENQHPEISVEGDPNTEDWLRAVAQVSRLWQQMYLARTYGGAVGSVAVGFQFVQGKPVIEVHDPRWLFPEFVEHGSMELVALEKRYRYPKEILDPQTLKWATKEFWYRRVIDKNKDTLFEPAPVDDGEEPDWVVAREAVHNFGFCPVIWVQNAPVQDMEDGDPDLTSAAYQTVEAIDALISQAHRGIIANCDPTLVITSKAELNEVRVGSDNALRVPDGSASYLELTASGPKAAMEQAAQYRKHVLEMAACVLEHPDIAGKTATEVERMYQSMLARADVYREQYGMRCVIPLLEMIYRAATLVAQPRSIVPQEQPLAEPPAVGSGEAPGPVVNPDEGSTPQLVATDSTGTSQEGVDEVNDGVLGASQTPSIVRGMVLVPPRYEKDLMGNMVPKERIPGAGGTVTLKWPGYFQPSLDDVTKAVTAASGALSGGLVDDETAIGFIAPYFKVEDQTDLLEKVRAGAAQGQADLFGQMMGGAPADPTQAPPNGAAPDPNAPPAPAPQLPA
jgi:hypothetical protein